MSNKTMGGGANAQHGARTAGKLDPEAETDEFDLASDIKGNNSLQGEDQEHARSERQAQAEATGRTMDMLDAIAGKRPDQAGNAGDGQRDPRAGERWVTTGVDADEEIRQRAYRLWEEAGRPDGEHEAHWFEAERRSGRGADKTTREPEHCAPRHQTSSPPDAVAVQLRQHHI